VNALLRHTGLPAPVTLLISALAGAAATGLAVTAGATVEALHRHGFELLGFLLVTLALQAGSIKVGSRGSMSVSAIGVLAAGFALGTGPAMAIALVAAVVQWIRRRGAFHRGLFDVSNFATTAAAGALAYALLTSPDSSPAVKIGAAALAGSAYMVANLGPLCLAMSLTERTGLVSVWGERFRWLVPHYVAFGLLAVAATLAYSHVGAVALAVLALPHAAVLVGHRRLTPAH
jgi:hypothetical protein